MEGIAMLGMFNTGRNDTGTRGEMADFSHGINLVESYLPDAISCLARTPALKIFQAATRAKTLIALRCKDIPPIPFVLSHPRPHHPGVLRVCDSSERCFTPARLHEIFPLQADSVLAKLNNSRNCESESGMDHSL